MKLEITDKEVYETKVYTIEGENGEGYVVTMHDSFMDFITGEIQVVDFNNDEVNDKELIDELITLIEASENGPEFDSAGFSIADRFEDEVGEGLRHCGDDYYNDEEESHHCDDPGCNCSI